MSNQLGALKVLKIDDVRGHDEDDYAMMEKLIRRINQLHPNELQ